MEPDSDLSPALLRKVVPAATHATSFRAAQDDLQALAEVKVSEARVRRAAERVGQERVAQSEAAAKAYADLPLPARQQSPGVPPPEVACVQADGGRLQIRPRGGADTADESTRWWREMKGGCLLRMTSDRHEQDPTPKIPEPFLDLDRMARMVREIKGFSSETAPAEEDPSAEEDAAAVYEAPWVVDRTVVATRQNVEAFGARLVAAAHALGFGSAQRKAFVADGSDTHGGVWRRHFSHYTPIVDWIHALCYIDAAAFAGVEPHAGSTTYRRWARWLWRGDVDPLLEELRGRLAGLPTPAGEECSTSPRERVAEALRYLQNQRSRMNYPEYRRQGLPITSSHMESTIKCLNRRMKGTEKFWHEGAEPMLHLVPDRLSPPAVLDRYWSQRPAQLTGQRRYQTAA